jgi:hypothetical protein
MTAPTPATVPGAGLPHVQAAIARADGELPHATAAPTDDVQQVPYEERLSAIERKFMAFGFNGPTPADRERDHAIGYLLDRLGNARERLERARHALIEVGYFTADEVGDDIAPRITELVSHLRQPAAAADDDDPDAFDEPAPIPAPTRHDGSAIELGTLAVPDLSAPDAPFATAQPPPKPQPPRYPTVMPVIHRDQHIRRIALDLAVKFYASDTTPVDPDDVLNVAKDWAKWIRSGDTTDQHQKEN